MNNEYRLFTKKNSPLLPASIASENLKSRAPSTRPLLTIISVAALLVGCETLHIKKTDPNAAVPSVQQPEVLEPAVEIKEPTQVYGNVWDRIRRGYGLPQVSNPQVDKQIKFYTSNKSYFSRVTQQSEPYLHYVVTEMQANNVPLELVLLPFIESAYNPSAVSPGQNAGMWQIAAVTGRNFGLKQNSWYDGRKDVVASTDAAIRLLKKLYTMFDNDWLLAVAAYNAGEGTIQRAIEKNKRAGKPTDFWSLPLVQTTQTYVPQLLALSKIVADPDRYDFKLHPISDAPYFVKVNVDSQINFAQAAQSTDIDASELKKLNAGYNGWLTAPTGSQQLLVPVADAAAFTLHLDSLPKSSNVKWQEHVVRKGDSVDSIGKKYGVSAATIKTVNNLKSSAVGVGQRLQIPLSLNANSPSVANVSTITTTNESSNGNSKSATNTNETNTNRYYTVKSGDNLWTIAKSQNTSVKTIAQLNGLNTKSALKAGQRLIVAQAVTPAGTASDKITYTIKPGDTLGAIANNHNVTIKKIMEWNNLTDESSIRPDQVLVIQSVPKS